MSVRYEKHTIDLRDMVYYDLYDRPFRKEMKDNTYLRLRNMNTAHDITKAKYPKYTEYLKGIISMDADAMLNFTMVDADTNPFHFLGLSILPETLDVVLYNSGVDGKLVVIGNFYKFIEEMGYSHTLDEVVEMMLALKIGKSMFKDFVSDMKTVQNAEVFTTPSVILNFINSHTRTAVIPTHPNHFIRELQTFIRSCTNTADVISSFWSQMKRVNEKYDNAFYKALNDSSRWDYIQENKADMEECRKKFEAVWNTYPLTQNNSYTDLMTTLTTQVIGRFDNFKDNILKKRGYDKDSIYDTSNREAITDDEFLDYMGTNRNKNYVFLGTSSNIGHVKNFDSADVWEKSNKDELLLTNFLDILMVDKQIRDDVDIFFHAIRYFADDSSDDTITYTYLANYLMDKMATKFKGLITKQRIEISNGLMLTNLTDVAGNSDLAGSSERHGFLIKYNPLHAVRRTSDVTGSDSAWRNARYFIEKMSRPVDAKNTAYLASEVRTEIFSHMANVKELSPVAHKLFKKVLDLFPKK